MSHFTVTVRVPAEFSIDEIDEKVQEMLRPFYEQGGPDDDFMVFEDKTDEALEEYESKMIEQVVFNGQRFYTHDYEVKKIVEESKKARGLEFDSFRSPTNEDLVDAGGVIIEIPVKEKYNTFDEFVEKYHGYRSNKDGRYGYWTNPNAKWDWYQIGGRWSGHWPAKSEASTGTGERSWANEDEEIPSNMVDIIRIRDLDLALVERETVKRIKKFLTEYKVFFETGEEPGNNFYGVRSDGLGLGLVQCLDENEITAEQRESCRLKVWAENRWINGVPRYDVISPIPEDDKFLEFLQNQYYSLRTYAYLDGSNWVEPGEMGWFGMSSASADSRKQYSSTFRSWIHNGNQDDWIVCVDCHI